MGIERNVITKATRQTKPCSVRSQSIMSMKSVTQYIAVSTLHNAKSCCRCGAYDIRLHYVKAMCIRRNLLTRSLQNA